MNTEGHSKVNPVPLRALLPLYVGAFVIVATGVQAVAMSAASPDFGFVATALAAASCVIAAMVRRRSDSNAVMSGLFIAGALILGGTRLAGYAPGTLLYPSAVVGNPDTLLAASIALVNVGYCLALVRPGRFAFTVVPTLAVFGLTSPLNLQLEMVLSFLVYVFASIFVMGYERLVEEELAEGQPVTRRAVDLAHSRLLATSFVFLLIVAFGLAVGPVLERTVPRLAGPMAARGARMLASLSFPAYATQDSEGFLIGHGPIRLSDQPVMLVGTDQPGLLRGQVYDEYTGSGWRRARDEARHLTLTQRPVSLAPYLREGLDGPRLTVRQRVVPVPLLGRIVFGRGAPASVAVLTEDDEADAAVDAYGAIRLDGLSVPQRGYIVWSAVPQPTPEQLRAARVPGPDELDSGYFVLPAGTERAAARIVSHIVTSEHSAYDKAVAIRGYLAANHQYTLDGPYIPPTNDAAIEFLTYHRRGACDLFASAYVVLARAAGLPARVATGFGAGEYDAEQGAWVVRENDAHAWAEVYFEGLGWIEFDPTAGATDAAPSVLGLLRIGQYWSFLSVALRRLLVIGGALLVFGFAFAALVNVRSAYECVRAWHDRRRRGLVGALEQAYLDVCHALARRGWQRAAWQTAAEYAAEVEDALGLRHAPITATLRAATVAIERAKYGGQIPTAEELDRLRRRVGQARRLARRLPRQRVAEASG